MSDFMPGVKVLLQVAQQQESIRFSSLHQLLQVSTGLVAYDLFLFQGVYVEHQK